jgi:ribose/xylose/arabinose/galactoside ABC-type transport system permease subunit
MGEDTTELEKANNPRKSIKVVAKNVIRHENSALLIVLVVLIAIMSYFTKGAIATRVNAVNVLLQSSVRGFAAIGQAFVVLSSGIDVSVGGVGLFCSMLGTSLMTTLVDRSLTGVPVHLSGGIAAMLFAGIGWGLINGSLVSRISMPPLIVTLGMWQITRGAAYRLTNGLTIHKLPANLAFFGNGDIRGVPVPIIIFIIIAIITYVVLNYSTFGRNIYASGGNPTSAWLSGIKVRKVQLMVYAISGFLASIAAIVWAGRIMSASMDSLSGLELDSIAAVFVGGVSISGGKGNLIGVILGVLIIGVINNGMSLLGANTAVQGIVKGVIIVMAVVVDCLRRREDIAHTL